MRVTIKLEDISVIFTEESEKINNELKYTWIIWFNSNKSLIIRQGENRINQYKKELKAVKDFWKKNGGTDMFEYRKKEFDILPFNIFNNFKEPFTPEIEYLHLDSNDFDYIKNNGRTE